MKHEQVCILKRRPRLRRVRFSTTAQVEPRLAARTLTISGVRHRRARQDDESVGLTDWTEPTICLSGVVHAADAGPASSQSAFPGGPPCRREWCNGDAEWREIAGLGSSYGCGLLVVRYPAHCQALGSTNWTGDGQKPERTGWLPVVAFRRWPNRARGDSLVVSRNLRRAMGGLGWRQARLSSLETEIESL